METTTYCRYIRNLPIYVFCLKDLLSEDTPALFLSHAEVCEEFFKKSLKSFCKSRSGSLG